MYGLNLFFYFLLYSFIGWIGEVIFAFYVHHRFVNRGFLNGPLCPIYGAGALIFIGLGHMTANPALLFLIAAFAATFLELITGFLLEKIFRRRYWDYSHSFMNFHGYISLGASLVWGVAGIAAVYVIHPLISSLVENIPTVVLQISSIVFLFLFAFDLAWTIGQNLKLSKRLQALKEMTDLLVEKRSQKRQYKNLSKRYQRTLYSQSYGERRILQAFPNLKSKTYHQALEAIYNTQNRIRDQFDQARKSYRKSISEAKNSYVKWKKTNQEIPTVRGKRELKKQYRVNRRQLKYEYRHLKKGIRTNPIFHRSNKE